MASSSSMMGGPVLPIAEHQTPLKQKLEDALNEVAASTPPTGTPRGRQDNFWQMFNCGVCQTNYPKSSLQNVAACLTCGTNSLKPGKFIKNLAMHEQDGNGMPKRWSSTGR